MRGVRPQAVPGPWSWSSSASASPCGSAVVRAALGRAFGALMG